MFFILSISLLAYLSFLFVFVVCLLCAQLCWQILMYLLSAICFPLGNKNQRIMVGWMFLFFLALRNLFITRSLTLSAITSLVLVRMCMKHRHLQSLFLPKQ